MFDCVITRLAMYSEVIYGFYDKYVIEECFVILSNYACDYVTKQYS